MLNRAHVAPFALFASMMAACSSNAPSAESTGNDAGLPQASSVDSGSTASGNAGDAGAPDSADAATAVGNCDEYCTAVMEACSHIGDGYPNTDICLAHCKALPLGVVGDHDDTVGCRQGHALKAADAPFEECPLAGPFPTSGCGDPCDAFCKLATAACGDQWQGHCAEDCAKWPPNPNGTLDTSGDTLSCRQTNVEHAFEGDPDSVDAGSGCGSVGTNSALCR